MGNYSRNLRELGMAHLIIGILLLICGIGDRLYGGFWMKPYGFGIWIGIVMMITGILGIVTGRNKRPFPGHAFLVLAIISSLSGLMIVLLYGISISTPPSLLRAVAFSYGIIILGGIQTIIGLMATVYSCLWCCGSTPATPEDVTMSTANSQTTTPGGPVTMTTEYTHQQVEMRAPQYVMNST